MNSGRIKKSHWRNGIQITRAAALVDAAAICVGVAQPRLFQLKVLALLALVAIGLNVLATLMLVWQFQLRSRRLRIPLFWLSLALNVLLMLVVGFFFQRGMRLPTYSQQDVGVREAPE